MSDNNLTPEDLCAQLGKVGAMVDGASELTLRTAAEVIESQARRIAEQQATIDRLKLTISGKTFVTPDETKYCPWPNHVQPCDCQQAADQAIKEARETVWPHFNVAEWLRERGRDANEEAMNHTKKANGYRTTAAVNLERDACVYFALASDIDRLYPFQPKPSPPPSDDVARYQWLRGNGAIISRAAGIPVQHAHFGIGLDAAIDKARGALPHEPDSRHSGCAAHSGDFNVECGACIDALREPDTTQDEEFEPMPIDSPSGTRVQYMDRNGYNSDIAACRDAGLVKGGVYSVVDVDVHQSSSSVYLEGFKHGFNTVCFRVVGETEGVQK